MQSSTILFHICCACCATYVYRKLKECFLNVIGFWYNPNIHPFSEYKKRLEAVKDFEKKEKAKIIYNENYDIEKFFQKIAGNENNRCEICYEIRLTRLAEKASENNILYFTTTLLISPYQNKEKIRIIGNKIAYNFNINFYFKDFSVGYKESIKISKELNLYRQKYCGCLYSEKERY